MDKPKHAKQRPPTSLESYPFGLRTIMELFDVGPGVAIGVTVATLLVVGLATFYFVYSAPPSTIVISSGPEGSSFQKNALKYAKILERDGVTVKVVTSSGSLENLQRVADPKAHVDVGIVQGGITIPGMEKLASLGSISYQPLLLFYRGQALELLSQLAGKRVGVGQAGSGTRNFAMSLLAVNGIKEGGTTTLEPLDGDAAAQALSDGKLDAAFVMSESASSDIMHKLLRSHDIHLYSYKQAAAYSRKIDYLNILDLPEGAVDFGQDIPPHDITLLGPMVELVVAKTLHPALSDLIIGAATEVHNHPGVFQRRGEFPAPIEHAIPIAEDATRFYKSGKTFMYRYLPFWLASLLSRIIVVFLPMLVVLIPAVRSVPAFFAWTTQMRIRRRYRELLTLEQDLLAEVDQAKQKVLQNEFDRIETAVNKMKVRAAFADQFYGLRGHIDYVRELMDKRDHSAP